MTEDVLTFVEGRAGRIRLNRPKALHALTEAMCRAMVDALLAWVDDSAVELVLIDHVGDRGFCAGGDVRAASVDGDAARRFFFVEYQLNHLLFTYAKPVVAFMDGVVMGGGVGIALPARYRIATERTVLAMPEATIGLFPDVGGGWYLSRLPGRLGQYLALTAARLNGSECLAVGLATHFVASDALDALGQRLTERSVADLPELLTETATSPGPAPIIDRQAEIDRLFASDTMEDVLAALAADEGAFAQETLRLLRSKSPQSCKVALRLLHASRSLTDFADEMRIEYGVAAHVCQRHDFIEGVRALLIDRDNAPRWDPATADGVTDHMLDTIFAPLPDDEAWEPLRR